MLLGKEWIGKKGKEGKGKSTKEFLVTKIGHTKSYQNVCSGKGKEKKGKEKKGKERRVDRRIFSDEDWGYEELSD